MEKDSSRGISHVNNPGRDRRKHCQSFVLDFLVKLGSQDWPPTEAVPGLLCPRASLRNFPTAGSKVPDDCDKQTDSAEFLRCAAPGGSIMAGRETENRRCAERSTALARCPCQHCPTAVSSACGFQLRWLESLGHFVLGLL